MQTGIYAVLATGLVVALMTAVMTDLRARIIPNRLTLAIGLAAPLWWWSSGLPLWPGAAVQLALGGLALAAFFGVFAIGAMGGGDVKLIAALGLWLLPGDFLRMLMWMALAGGLLTLAMLAWHKLRRLSEQPEIPYGVAIVAATLPVFAERYFYHLGP
jgi:prepilin peptidase CpaA